ncbi:putative toxin-antitoxin system toxin component, PIN family [Caenimonas sp. SL110]|uniref:putative toxin-antitoxin system toxin component, PIN family n=1 Tax=Caenimonas sp. SL110 TaxID=1450524 RepID=UPI0006536E88|nr:putative toxin-antitoxin system toxin component, PIN family [Caenimonas sp. SL110]
MIRTTVLDTNIVLDLFIFSDEAARPLREQLEQGALRWIATERMRGELERVLAYPHIVSRMAFYGKTAQDVLAAFDRHAQIAQTPGKARFICKDADDQMFIDLAVQHQCLLLSKDKAVLTMKKRLASLDVEVMRALT